MARLENCPTCGNQTSENASQCPTCGEPLKPGWATVIQEERQHKDRARKKAKLRKGQIIGSMIIVLVAIFFGPSLYEAYTKIDVKEIEPVPYRQKIDVLEKQVARVPASNFDENIRLYQRLLELDPQSQRYAAKIVHYRQKKKTATATKQAARKAAEAKPEIVLDIMEIAGKSQAVVASILGKPDRCEKIKYDTDKRADKCYYGEGSEIVYIRDKADWITLFVDAPFSPKALSLIGIAPPKPSFANKNTIRWNNIENLRKVMMFPKGNGKVHYIYVMALTE